MEVNKAELQSALEKVKPGLANRELIEQATSFAFMGDRVVTYNDEISISHPVKALNVHGAVKAEALYSFLNRVKQESIKIEFDDNQVKITAGRSKAGLVFEQEVKLPIEEVGEIGSWKPLPDGFVDALKMCHGCCSRDMSLPVLTCVHIDGDLVVASDDYQIIKYQLPGPVPLDPFLLPATAARELTRYKLTEIAQGTGWVHFATEDGTVFSSRVFEGTYPDVSGHFEFNGEDVQFPEGTTEALERARIFSHSDLSTQAMPVVTVEFNNNQMKISAEGQSGWFQEDLQLEYEGEPIRFSTNVEFLLALLAQSTSCSYGEGRVLFSGEEWSHLIATMAIEDDA